MRRLFLPHSYTIGINCKVVSFRVVSQLLICCLVRCVCRFLSAAEVWRHGSEPVPRPVPSGPFMHPCWMPPVLRVHGDLADGPDIAPREWVPDLWCQPKIQFSFFFFKLSNANSCWFGWDIDRIIVCVNWLPFVIPALQKMSDKVPAPSGLQSKFTKELKERSEARVNGNSIKLF